MKNEWYSWIEWNPSGTKNLGSEIYPPIMDVDNSPILNPKCFYRLLKNILREPLAAMRTQHELATAQR